MTFNVDFLRAIPKEPERDPLRLLDIINQNKISMASIAAQNTRAKDYASAIEAPKQFQITPELIAATRSNQQQPQDINSILSTMRQIKDLQGGNVEGITPYQQAQIDLQYAQLDAQNQENEAAAIAAQQKAEQAAQQELNKELLKQQPELMKIEAEQQKQDLRAKVKEQVTPLLQDRLNPNAYLTAANIARQAGDDDTAKSIMEQYTAIKPTEQEEKQYQEVLTESRKAEQVLPVMEQYQRTIQELGVTGMDAPITKLSSPQKWDQYQAQRANVEMALRDEMRGTGSITEQEQAASNARLGSIYLTPRQAEEQLKMHQLVRQDKVKRGIFYQRYKGARGTSEGADEAFLQYKEYNPNFDIDISTGEVVFPQEIVPMEAFVYNKDDPTKYYTDNNLPLPPGLIQKLEQEKLARSQGKSVIQMKKEAANKKIKQQEKIIEEQNSFFDLGSGKRDINQIFEGR